eukprot:3444546-Rhodomonas_salina.1
MILVGGRMCLRCCYALPGTNAAYGATSVCPYAMPSTNAAYVAAVVCPSAAATKCTVLTLHMVLPGAHYGTHQRTGSTPLPASCRNQLQSPTFAVHFVPAARFLEFLSPRACHEIWGAVRSL